MDVIHPPRSTLRTERGQQPGVCASGSRSRPQQIRRRRRSSPRPPPRCAQQLGAMPVVGRPPACPAGRLGAVPAVPVVGRPPACPAGRLGAVPAVPAVRTPPACPACHAGQRRETMLLRSPAQLAAGPDGGGQLRAGESRCASRLGTAAPRRRQPGLCSSRPTRGGRGKAHRLPRTPAGRAEGSCSPPARWKANGRTAGPMSSWTGTNAGAAAVPGGAAAMMAPEPAGGGGRDGGGRGGHAGRRKTCPSRRCRPASPAEVNRAPAGLSGEAAEKLALLTERRRRQRPAAPMQHANGSCTNEVGSVSQIMMGCISSGPANVGVYRRPALPKLGADMHGQPQLAACGPSSLTSAAGLKIGERGGSSMSAQAAAESRRPPPPAGWPRPAGGSGGCGALALGTCTSNHGSEESSEESPPNISL